MRRGSLLGLVINLICAVAVGQQPAGPGERPAAEVKTDRPSTDDSTTEFRRAVALQQAGKWLQAQKALRAMLEKWPDSVHKDEADDRSDDNAFLGCEVVHRSGPPERRIDVSVMGDGFTIDIADQNLQEKWAKLCLDVLFSEAGYSEYRDYFNFYFVRLASLEEGVDPNLSPEEKRKIEEKNKTRTRKKKTEFSTALDCKAAGPQGQVMADRRLVHKWLRVAKREEDGCDNDGLVIAFARFGILGMGGGGIANVGRPDRSITVHEFGHAFGGLLDEYTGNPTPPERDIRAPNASMTPDPTKVPWAHFLEKKVPGVGVFEGGATYTKGVWKPARSCAMNAAGNNQYCPVCREAVILKIYAYVNPMDASSPVNSEFSIKTGADAPLTVVPMEPEKHKLDVKWYVAKAVGKVSEPERPKTERRTGFEGEPSDDNIRMRDWMREAGFGRFTGGTRQRGDRSEYDRPPEGELSSSGTTKKPDAKSPTQHIFQAGRLEPGVWKITAVVKDPTPWVLKDEKHLLEERRTWTITVLPAK